MIVSDTAVRQRVAVMVLSLIILGFGGYCYSVMPRESDPDITIPYVFISTGYKGVSSNDIETSITNEIEKKLKGLEGVKKIQSISSEGNSYVTIEFVTGTDIDDALEKVRNKVDEAKNELPDDIDQDPSVFEVNFSEMPIVVFSISGTCGNQCLKIIADRLEDEVEAVPGVLDVEMVGALEREIRVEVIPEKLAYYGIPVSAFERVVHGENQNVSGGAIRMGDGRFQLRVPGEFRSPQEIYGLIVGTHEGDPIYLKDVARVVDGFKDEDTRARLDGREAVTIAVKKRAGENIIRITDAVDGIIAGLEPTWPSGTRITKVMDKAKDIRSMVADLENNILSGLLLVVVVLFFAMGLRNALIVSMAIPFSMLLSFIVLYGMGITLNMVVLFSLTLALGMLVDNAIVIVENVYRHMEQGVPRVEAAMRATSEVAYPVMGSTVTTLVAFAPMLYWPGIMGEFMSYLPLTLIVTLSSSLFVAMVINPALAAYFMKPREGKAPADVEDLSAGERPVELEGLVFRTYARILRGALRHRTVVVLTSAVLLVLFWEVWLLVVGLERPVEFFPYIDPKALYVNVDMPEGSDIEFSDRVLRQIEMRIGGVTAEDINDPALSTAELYARAYETRTHPRLDGGEYAGTSDLDNVKHVYSRAVAVPLAGMAFEPTTPNNIGVEFIDLTDRITPTGETLDAIRERVEDVPGGKVTIAAAEEGPPTGAPVNIEISGEDYRILGGIAKEIRAAIEDVPFVEDVRDDYVEGTPSVRVRVDRQRAALFGLSTDAVGFALKTGYNGLDVSTYREGDEDYDITVRLSEPDRRVTDVLRELMIPTPGGRLVPLTTIATVDYAGGIGDIVHINHERVVTVKANVDETKVPGAVARAQAEELLKPLPLPPGYKIKFTGEFEFQKESEEFLSKAFLVSLFLIFLVLVVQFNSVVQPFIIMTAVVLSLGGAFFGLTVIRSPFGIIMTGVGVISLAGVVVNNGIVLIDYVNRLRERGYGLEDAIVRGGATRLRPVFLTAVTTVLGLIPMMTGVSYDFHAWEMAWVSESSMWWKSMASVVIFGLMVATFLTLVLAPVLYSAFDSLERGTVSLTASIRRLYWLPYERITGRRRPEA